MEAPETPSVRVATIAATIKMDAFLIYHRLPAFTRTPLQPRTSCCMKDPLGGLMIVRNSSGEATAWFAGNIRLAHLVNLCRLDILAGRRAGLIMRLLYLV